MASPTQVNIGIGLDMDALKKSTGLARGEISSLMRDIKREQSDLEKFNQKKRVLDEALRVGAITPQKHTQMLRAYREEFDQLTQAEKQMAALMKRREALQERLNQRAETAKHIDRDRLRSMLEELKGRQRLTQEADRFIDRMARQYKLSDQIVRKLKEAEHARIAGATGGGGIGGMLTGGFGQFGTGVMAGFGFAGLTSAATQSGQALGDFIADSIKIAMERQRIGAAMEAMLGSQEAAEKLTDSMRKLDKQSMLTFGEISKGAQTLLGFGVAQDMVMPSLDALSKISLGNAERFQSLSLAFGQVAASGKLAGQEILQMVNAGFNPLQEIARVTGRDMALLKADVEAGKVSFLQVAEAIITATEAGGRFEKISEKMLATPAGMLAKLQSDFELIKADLGERLMPSLIQLFETIKSNEFVIDKLVSGIESVFVAFGVTLAVIEDYRNLFTKGTTGDPTKDFKKSFEFADNFNKIRFEQEKRRAEREAEEAKKKKEAEDFNKLSPEERKKRLAEEQVKMDALRADKERAKLRADMQKKIQDLEDGSEREIYFRQIGGHLAKTREEIQLINDAMSEFEQESNLRVNAERAKSLQEEINQLQEKSNKIKMSEIDLLLRKHFLSGQFLTLEEERDKKRLLDAKLQLDQDKAVEAGKKLETSRDPMAQANERAKELLDMLVANVGLMGNQNQGGLSMQSFQEEIQKLALDVLAKDKQNQMDVTTKAITAGSAEQKIMVAKLNEQNQRAAKAEQIQIDIRNNLQKIANNMGVGFALVP